MTQEHDLDKISSFLAAYPGATFTFHRETPIVQAEYQVAIPLNVDYGGLIWAGAPTLGAAIELAQQKRDARLARKAA